MTTMTLYVIIIYNPFNITIDIFNNILNILTIQTYKQIQSYKPKMATTQKQPNTTNKSN